jgi:hypothetical protein
MSKEDTELAVEVKKCPEHCKFDWKKFHNDIDIALAHMIDEKGTYPSKTSLMDFLVYSNAKKELSSDIKEKDSE